ncbi:isochorismate synthase MenF [Corynebacterium sp. 13CS0277]|uniref:isochorismate synthase n=1 Tax=Corynebacterium sp. 13CS0277 TaxID=2071994 RepID=UPI001304B6F9|nr:chorismate-binding protein [Corynebacterium sp. 13CS0277]
MPANFSFRTRHYLLHASGVARRIAPKAWDAARLRQLAGDDMVVGAVPFSPQATARLFVPREWERLQRPGAELDDEGAALAPATHAPTMQHGARLDGFDERGDFRTTVARGLEAIAAGDVDKVVLSRQVVGTMPRPIPTGRLREKLWAANPYAYGYDLALDAPWLLGRAGVEAPTRAPEGASCHASLPAHTREDLAHLLGASPELVLKVSGRTVSTFPLAGSIPRSQDPAEDARRADFLRSSHKNLAEHAHVTADIARVLRSFCTDVDIPDGPEVLATPVIWHLGTHMRGTLKPGVSSWDVLCALHPTPAVSGWPQAPAREVIRRLEPTPRGVFAGVVGWCEAGGDCEWAMTLRGGITHDRTAYAFAGAGIVAGSTPEEEYRETTTKLSTFLNPLLQVMGRPHHETLCGARSAPNPGLELY